MPATMKKARVMKARVDFFCLPEQRAKYEAAASLDGRTLASWIRHTLDLAAGSGVESGQHLPKLPKKGE